MITIVDVVNLSLNSAVLLIAGVLSVWIFKFQAERLAVKDERIILLAQERDAARTTAEERLNLSKEQREATQAKLDELLDQQTQLDDRNLSGVSESDLTASILLSTLFEMLDDRDQNVEGDESTKDLGEEM